MAESNATHPALPPAHTEPATYVVERIIGKGSSASVFLARDPAHPERQVALKEFYNARDSEGRKRVQALWEREQEVGRQAGPHAALPDFYEAFTRDGFYYIAQQYIEGGTLDDILARRGPLPPKTILKWAGALTDALAFLHARQIVHHDVKPSNIRINRWGDLMLLDFGAAQFFGPGHEQDGPQTVYGTDGYLAPELEADGFGVVDVRTDIFALGCILFEMATGTAPEQAQINARSLNVADALRAHPGISPAFAAIIARAMASDKEARYPSAAALLNDLRQFTPPLALAVPPPPAVVQPLPAQTMMGGEDTRAFFVPSELPIPAAIRASSPIPPPPSRPNPGEPPIMPIPKVTRLVLAVIALTLVLGYFVGQKLAADRRNETLATTATETGATGGATPHAAPPVRAASSAALSVSSDDASNMLKPANDPLSWTFEQLGDARGSIQTDDDALQVNVERADGKHWHVQFFQRGIVLEEGHYYVLTFDGKAGGVYDVPLRACVDGTDHHADGLEVHPIFTKDWKTYSYKFQAANTDGMSSRCPSFQVGQKPGRFWLRNAKLTQVQ